MANELTAAQRVGLARQPGRPGTGGLIGRLVTDFFEQRGGRLCAEGGSILFVHLGRRLMRIDGRGYRKRD